MSGIRMDVIIPELLIWTISFSFGPATPGPSVFTGVHRILCFVLFVINLWTSVPSEKGPAFLVGSKFRSSVAYACACACANAFARIFITFGNLFMVDDRYISLAIIVVILQIFMVALFVTVSLNPEGHLKRDDNDATTATKTEDHTGKKEEEKIGELLWIVRHSYSLLCLVRHFSNMEMTNCLLFFSCSLGELTLMMARLPSEFDVAPASEVVHRAFLVMGLLTAHTMAAELLGEDVVLVCMPELVAALAWLTIYLGSSDNNAAAGVVDTVETVVRQAEIPLLCLVGILGSIIIAIYSADEAEGAMDLILILLLLWGNMSSAIAAFLSLVILPFLCMLALRQWHHQSWRGQTTVAPSAELEGAIRLLRLCRDNLWSKGIVLVCFAKPIIRLSANKLAVYLYPIFSVFGLILLLAAIMYARAHGLRGRRARAAVRGEKQD